MISIPLSISFILYFVHFIYLSHCTFKFLTSVRCNIGVRAILGSVRPTQSMWMVNIGVSSLPRPSEEPFSGYYWHNEMDTAMPFLQPDGAKGCRLKSALRKVSNRAA